MRATWWPGSRPRALVVLVATLLVWTSITSAVAAAAEKSFSATLPPEPLVAGGSYGIAPRDPITLTITNTSNQAQLGSANVTLPDGLALTAVSVVPVTGLATPVGQVIQLRNLNLQPGFSAVVSVSAQVECAANQAPYTWTFLVKQANDFNGSPGNNLTGTNPTSTVFGNCQLEFSKQPAHSEKTPTAITSVIYDPDGAPVTVSVVDDESDQTVSWWSGTVTLTIGDLPVGANPTPLTLGGSPIDGSIEFAPTIDISATGYSLIATAVATPETPSAGTDTAGLESDNFNIVDDATICGASEGCSATAGKGQKTEVTVDASSNGAAGDLVILSINDPTVTVNCTGYVETSDVVIFNVTGPDGETPAPDRSKLTTLTLAAAFVTKSASKYQVCYDDGSGPRLIPTCSTKIPAPCVVSKALDRTRRLVIVVSSPPGDPRLRL